MIPIIFFVIISIAVIWQSICNNNNTLIIIYQYQQSMVIKFGSPLKNNLLITSIDSIYKYDTLPSN